MDNRKELIVEMIAKRKTMKEIGKLLGGISRQRVYQLLTKYNLKTTERSKHSFWKTQTTQQRWFWKLLCSKPSLTRIEKWEIYQFYKDKLPKYCPILGYQLNYENNTPLSRDTSPSIDRIDSTKPYTINNIQLISWRANRIKNDGTFDELRKIANYLEGLVKI